MEKKLKNKKGTVHRTVKATVKKKKPTVEPTVKNKKRTVKPTVKKPLAPASLESKDVDRRLATYNYAMERLGNLEGKTDFEIFQAYRDLFVEMLIDSEQARVFTDNDAPFRLISKFQLFDPAYLDNFLLCAMLKTASSKNYNEAVTLIDKHVRPEKKNEGKRYIYQESAGFLALLLYHYEGVSRRHALRVAAQLTKYSEGTVEKPFIRMRALREDLGESLPPPDILAVLYWTLYEKKTNPDGLEPFKKKSPRSEKEMQKAIDAYWRFSEKVARQYQQDILRFLKENPVKIIPKIAKEFGIPFPLSDQDMKKPPAPVLLFITATASFLKELPEVAKQLDKQYDAMAKEIA